MARFTFNLPDIGEGIAEAEIVAWHVKVGDTVEEDQQLADMMTDKATVEMESPVSGTVVSLAGEVGDQIAIGSTLVVIEVEGEASAEPETKAEEVAEEIEAETPGAADAEGKTPAYEAETPSPLVGEGRGPLASASGKGEGDVSSPTPPHPSATASLPPSPTRGEGNKSLSYTPENEEAALMTALDSAAPAAAAAVKREDFEGAMAALASLRAPIDAFFDKVTVNDADPAKRTARLALLARVRDAVHGVADFSKIEG